MFSSSVRRLASRSLRRTPALLSRPAFAGSVRGMATGAEPLLASSAATFLLGALTATGAWYFIGGSSSGDVDYNQVRAEIIEVFEDLDYDDGSYIPVLVRLAWHASGTYNKRDGTGGSDGATMRFKPESAHGANAGLILARDRLKAIKEKYPSLTYADLWSLAGAVAIEEAGGPKIQWRPGRSDAMDERSCTPDGRLPDAAQGAGHVRDVFYRMGFNDQEIVALIGAHALGRCHKDRSGFDGPWTRAPTSFSNSFFTELLNNEWHKKNWSGPAQYEDPSGELMMLPTDIAVKTDPEFRKWAQKYADDEELFFKDFAAAFQKLQELGCQNLKEPAF